MVSCLANELDWETPHLRMSALKELLARLLRGLSVMQSQACLGSMESGENTTGTSKLAPSAMCRPADHYKHTHCCKAIQVEHNDEES